MRKPEFQKAPAILDRLAVEHLKSVQAQSPSHLPAAQAVAGGTPTLALCQDCGTFYQSTRERINAAEERNRYGRNDGNRLCPACEGDLCYCADCVRHIENELSFGDMESVPFGDAF